MRAEALERNGRLDEAEQIYRRLLQTHPEHAAVLHNLALVAKSRGDLGEAEALLRRGITAEPREPALYNALGAVLRAGGSLSQAETAYRKAIELWATFAEAHYNLGVVLEEMGRHGEALAAYRNAVALQPAFGKALTRIGALLNEQGAKDEALVHLDRAAEAAPEFFDAHYYRGWVLSALGRNEEALTALGRAAALRPDSFEATLATANALRDAGRTNEALSAYWRLVEMRPDRAATHEEINKLAWMAGRQDLYLRSFAYVRERRGEDPELLHLEAAFRLRRNEFGAAEPLLRRARMLAPGRGEVAGLLARALAGLAKFEESYALFTEAIGAQPGVILHRQEFGFTLLRDHQPAQALTVFEQANALNPFDQLVLAGMSLAYRQLGDARYHRLVDFSRYVRIYDLTAPPGFRDVPAFNRALAEELDTLHTAKVEPIDQTVRGGTQTTGRLFDQKSPAIQEARECISAAVEDYIQHVSKSPPDSTGMRREGRFRYAGSWSCRLASGGYHNNHVHPQGWISSAYYARLPEDLDDPVRRHGWLKFGESNLALGERDQPDFFVKPAVGRLVLFPSFYWHGTEPFTEAGERLGIAFDVVPSVVPTVDRKNV